MGNFQEPEILRIILMSPLKEILSIRKLRIGYHSGKSEKCLLPPLTMNAYEGELIAIIGKNGIGKSTLLRTITGLQPSLGGDIVYSGYSIKKYSRIELARKIGYISTEQVKVSNMSVYDLVSLGRFPYTNWFGKIDSENHKHIMDALHLCSMTAFSSRLVSELSDGERQRAMIARLLAQDTGVMVMDEPTAFLDIGSKYEILHLLSRLAHEKSKTIIYSTHDLHLATGLSDSIWFILGNRLISGAPEDLMIEGVFEDLFHNSPVRFNADDGTFSFKDKVRGNVCLKGDGRCRYWTEMALNRAGFSVAKDTEDSGLKITAVSDTEFILTTPGSEYHFYSIYEMMRFINQKDINPI
jgi:iron complex transport system ATP-binding protein